MGGGADETEAGSATPCDGTDVIKILNDAFGDPGTEAYQKAKQDKLFSEVNTGYGLARAYRQAGLTVSINWEIYLRRLSSANAEAIAKARETALNQGLPMTTRTHKEADPIHHDVTITVSDTLTAISSPYDMDGPPS